MTTTSPTCINRDASFFGKTGTNLDQGRRKDITTAATSPPLTKENKPPAKSTTPPTTHGPGNLILGAQTPYQIQAQGALLPIFHPLHCPLGVAWSRPHLPQATFPPSSPPSPSLTTIAAVIPHPNHQKTTSAPSTPSHPKAPVHPPTMAAALLLLAATLTTAQTTTNPNDATTCPFPIRGLYAFHPACAQSCLGCDASNETFEHNCDVNSSCCSGPIAEVMIPPVYACVRRACAMAAPGDAQASWEEFCEELCGEGEGGQGGGDAGGVPFCELWYVWSFFFLGSMVFVGKKKKGRGGVGMLTRMLNRGAVGDEDGGDVPREDGAC